MDCLFGKVPSPWMRIARDEMLVPTTVMVSSLWESCRRLFLFAPLILIGMVFIYCLLLYSDKQYYYATLSVPEQEKIKRYQIGNHKQLVLFEVIEEKVAIGANLNNFGSSSTYRAEDFSVVVDGSKIGNFLTHFWRSTGFCPPLPHQNFSNYFFADSEVQNLAHLGSVPNDGIKQVRIHWLLDLVTANVTGPGQVNYNFTNLDEAMDLLKQNGLKPGFEIMGNPSDMYTDMENKTQVYMWRELVETIAKRYIDRYGLDYVAEWNFESWNEPNNRDFDTLQFTIQGFLNYYDACSEGLTAAHPSLILGTPANGWCGYNPASYCYKLLKHCTSGTNYFTGEKGVRVDFLSFHLKGRGSTSTILGLESQQYQVISKKFPTLKSIPFYNDEGDPLGGWATGAEWRADVRYAAMVVKIIAQHVNLLLPKNPGLNYQLISNDNGFLNFGPPHFFDQRTLTARFLMNLTKPKSVQLVRKPVLSVMGLLSLLGSRQINSTVLKGTQVLPANSDIGVIATLFTKPHDLLHYGEVAVMIYNSDDTSSVINSSISCSLQWRHLPDLGENALMMMYRLDNIRTNPYDIWQKAGKPVYPSYELLDQMRNAIDSNQISLAMPYSQTGNLSVSLPLPSVVLLHACAKPATPPSKVMGLRAKLIVAEQAMLIWNDVPERCLLTYEVATSDKSDGLYTPINSNVHVQFSLYVHWIKNPSTKPLYYKVRAVDYWGQDGEYSDVACIPC